MTVVIFLYGENEVLDIVLAFSCDTTELNTVRIKGDCVFRNEN